MFTFAIAVLAILALLSIAFEEITHINKAKSTLFLGCLCWCLLFFRASGHDGTEALQESLNENLLDIASLWLFLMATMTFVAYLNARGLINSLVARVLPSRLSRRQLTLLLGAFSLGLSMLCDNITATLVALSVIQAFQLEIKEKVRLAVLAVFAINSGGVILITGDVTTLMIFSAGHVGIADLLRLILPAVVGVCVMSALLCFGRNPVVEAHLSTEHVGRLDWVIGGLFFTTILSTMVFNVAFGIPPVLTFLTGLATMFLIGGFVNKYHHEVHLLEYVRQIQFDTLMFFLGILLIVGALKEVDVLTAVLTLYFAFSPDISNFVLGTLSALLDNVPLTAAVLKADPQLSQGQWLGLTYAVGVGGSLLVIGSAAGIVAMSKMPELSFSKYARFAPQLLLSYGAGYATTIWLVPRLF